MRRHQVNSILKVLIWVTAILLVSANLVLAVSNFDRVRRAALLNACMANLKNLATMVETYSVDHGGKYPKTDQEVQEFTKEYVQDPIYCPLKGKYYDYALNPQNDTEYFFLCPGWKKGNAYRFKIYGYKEELSDIRTHIKDIKKIYTSSWPKNPPSKADRNVGYEHYNDQGEVVYPGVSGQYGTGYLMR